LRVLVAIFIALTLALSGPALAGSENKKAKDKGKSETQATTGAANSGKASAGRASDKERSIIESFLKQGKMPASYVNAEPLPPGIAKKLRRGGTLPPGIAKRTPPPELMRQLPQRPGQEWIVAGHDILLIEVATHVIVDVLTGMF
jgi:Ni/Co efflux regulator RcnB